MSKFEINEKMCVKTPGNYMRVRKPRRLYEILDKISKMHMLVHHGTRTYLSAHKKNKKNSYMSLAKVTRTQGFLNNQRHCS